MENTEKTSYEKITHRKKNTDHSVVSDVDVENSQEKEARENEVA